MKSKVLALTAVIAATQLLSLGCAKKSEGTSSTLTTSVVMTGSSAAATVAKSAIDKLLNLFMPQATALPVPSTQDASGATVNITAAWIAMKEIEFKAAETLAQEGAEDVGEEVKFLGPYYIDLLSSAPGPIDTQELPAKVYRRIKMKLEASGTAIPAGTPVELSSNSIYVTGTVGANSFTYLADDGTEFEISGPSGVSPEDGQVMLISLKLANVIKMIDMSGVANGEVISSANRVAGSCPLIDGSATDLYTCFRIGLEQQADFGKDSDGSGELEADEDNCDN